MTNKQMEGYKRDYFMRFDHEPVNIEYIWDWIEDLVEEVEEKTEEDLVGEYGTFGMRPED